MHLHHNAEPLRKRVRMNVLIGQVPDHLSLASAGRLGFSQRFLDFQAANRGR